jgi:phosphate transport system substrate-binding protein
VKKILITALIVATFSIADGLTSAAKTEVPIRVKGANSMWGRVRSLTLLYMKDHPDVDIAVSGHARAAEGITALITGEANVAMASRRITAQESEAARVKKLQLDEHLVGYGALVIVTDRQNSVNELSMDQVRKIFTGEIVNWKDINGKDQAVTAFKSGEKNPDTLLFVENDILGGVHISNSAITLPNFPAIIQKVGETPGSIAYVRMGDLYLGPQARAKSLKIRKDEHSPPVSASMTTISDGTYPLRRPYYLYTSATAGEEIRSLVDFVVRKGWAEQNLTHQWQ